jgi:hypothetical protein
VAFDPTIDLMKPERWIRSFASAFAALAVLTCFAVLRGFGSPAFDLLLGSLAIALISWSDMRSWWGSTVCRLALRHKIAIATATGILLASQARFLASGYWNVMYLMPLALLLLLAVIAVVDRLVADHAK